MVNNLPGKATLTPLKKRQARRLFYLGLALVAVFAAIGVALSMAKGPNSPDQLPSAQTVPELRPPRYLFAIGGPGQSLLVKPMVAIEGPDQNIIVADTGNAVVRVFDHSGQLLRVIGKPATGTVPAPGELLYPTGLALDDTGHLYVADTQAGKISVYDMQGEFMRLFGTPDVFSRPVGLLYHNSRLYVNDVGLQRVAVLDQEGSLITATEQAQLTFANYSAMSSRGQLAVADSNRNQVQLFDVEGTWTTAITQTEEGGLLMPRGIAYDSLGRLHVVSVFRHQVLVFGSDGRFLFAYGERGDGGGQLNFPNGLCISRDRIYIADKENNRVQVWQVAGSE